MAIAHTLMELVEILGKTVGWSKSTVATIVRRMEEKGIIRYEEQGRTQMFTLPKARKQ